MVDLIEHKYPNLSAIKLEKLIDYRQQLLTCFCVDYHTSSIVNNEIQRVDIELYKRFEQNPFNQTIANAICQPEPTAFAIGRTI